MTIGFSNLHQTVVKCLINIDRNITFFGLYGFFSSKFIYNFGWHEDDDALKNRLTAKCIHICAYFKIASFLLMSNRHIL